MNSHYQERVLAEYHELKDRCISLQNFIDHNPLYPKLSARERLLMAEQTHHMTWYLHALVGRIQYMPDVSL